MRGLCRTYCTPTRIAPTKRSPGSALAAFASRRQRQIDDPAAIDSTALSANTYSLPALAISAPATMGPTMRDAFIAMPFSASAAGNCARGTSSGTIAANTGQRIASPMPLAKVSASSSGALIASGMTTAAIKQPDRCDPDLRADEPVPAVKDVGQRAARQPEQEHRQRRRGLHQRHHRRRRRQRRHQPRRRHVVHPHADVGDQPGAPQHAEHGLAERFERGVSHPQAYAPPHRRWRAMRSAPAIRCRTG